jgi:hypothetical protein
MKCLFRGARTSSTGCYGSYPDLDELFQRQAAELDK